MIIPHPCLQTGWLTVQRFLSGVCILLSCIVQITPAVAEDFPWDWNKGKTVYHNTVTRLETSTPRLVASSAIKLFQKHISPADGPRCKFHPSCSQYCKIAIQRHGPFMGIILFSDRFMRDHGWISYHYPVIWINGQKLYFDPLTLNTFWWFDEVKPRNSELRNKNSELKNQ